MTIEKRQKNKRYRERSQRYKNMPQCKYIGVPDPPSLPPSNGAVSYVDPSSQSLSQAVEGTHGQNTTMGMASFAASVQPSLWNPGLPVDQAQVYSSDSAFAGPRISDIIVVRTPSDPPSTAPAAATSGSSPAPPSIPEAFERRLRALEHQVRNLRERRSPSSIPSSGVHRSGSSSEPATGNGDDDDIFDGLEVLFQRTGLDVSHSPPVQSDAPTAHVEHAIPGDRSPKTSSLGLGAASRMTGTAEIFQIKWDPDAPHRPDDLYHCTPEFLDIDRVAPPDHDPSRSLDSKVIRLVATTLIDPSTPTVPAWTRLHSNGIDLTPSNRPSPSVSNGSGMARLTQTMETIVLAGHWSLHDLPNYASSNSAVREYVRDHLRKTIS